MSKGEREGTTYDGNVKKVVLIEFQAESHAPRYSRWFVILVTGTEQQLLKTLSVTRGGPPFPPVEIGVFEQQRKLCAIFDRALVPSMLFCQVIGRRRDYFVQDLLR